MPRSRTTFVIALILLVIIVGISLAPQLTSQLAEQPEADRLVPAWDDLEVVYLDPQDQSSLPTLLNPNAFASEVNATIVNTADDVVRHAIADGLDILLIDKSVLDTVNQTWARSQYRQGTAFVGLNFTPHELEKLIGSPAFAGERSTDPLPEPFLTFAYVKLSGDARQIELLKQSDIVFPPSGADRARVGLDKVFVSTGASYMAVNETLTVPFLLNDIRLNLDTQNLVRPPQ